ncbi:hypothetical protein BU25DRAFT_491320 [Macroventuria anomochaeta]|uniref:Uncharacterized protein n=1 Tax=Macroventuria anomochaeta TaxID=301207 RepID=A0ACB6S115_9PLEO|nr:uncharacterized protein BU25DRAFT_491320 [Macroventuria anomochaeta]KAF2627723.1 hypothetical protein BU25DRAFT_491320 [Macroventuria anomochaeta]
MEDWQYYFCFTICFLLAQATVPKKISVYGNPKKWHYETAVILWTFLILTGLPWLILLAYCQYSYCWVAPRWKLVAPPEQAVMQVSGPDTTSRPFRVPCKMFVEAVTTTRCPILRIGSGSATTSTLTDGTASTALQAHVEQDTFNGKVLSTKQHYQTITFQQPYKDCSFEELGLTDYLQRRRYAGKVSK